MKLVKDSDGRYRDERGHPIIHSTLDDLQWNKLKSYLTLYTDQLTEDTRRQFDGLLTIWMHPWDVQDEHTTPSEAKRLIKRLGKAIAADRVALETLVRNGVLARATPFNVARWNDLLKVLADVPELVASTVEGIVPAKTGQKSDDAHAFVEQVDEILSEAGVPLEISENKGTDFIGFVACLCCHAEITPSVWRRRKPSNTERVQTSDESARTYAKSLIRAQVKRRNLIHAALGNPKEGT